MKRHTKLRLRLRLRHHRRSSLRAMELYMRFKALAITEFGLVDTHLLAVFRLLLQCHYLRLRRRR